MHNGYLTDRPLLSGVATNHSELFQSHFCVRFILESNDFLACMMDKGLMIIASLFMKIPTLPAAATKYYKYNIPRNNIELV